MTTRLGLKDAVLSSARLLEWVDVWRFNAE